PSRERSSAAAFARCSESRCSYIPSGASRTECRSASRATKRAIADTSLSSTEDQRIRSLRAPKPAVDPWKAHGSTIDSERRPGGIVERALTVFLAGAECPFTCSFCDLWRWTLDGPTPPGALPAQLKQI